MGGTDEKLTFAKYWPYDVVLIKQTFLKKGVTFLCCQEPDIDTTLGQIPCTGMMSLWTSKDIHANVEEKSTMTLTSYIREHKMAPNVSM